MGVASLTSDHTARNRGDRGDDEADRRERCDDLRATPPGIIELRMASAGLSPQLRELTIDGSGPEPSWAPASASDGPAWTTAENLSQLDFTPPLELAPNSVHYLAYAPAEPATVAETNQLDSFQAEFGGGAGTFNWHERVYQYALVPRLPCFPPSTAMR